MTTLERAVEHAAPGLYVLGVIALLVMMTARNTARPSTIAESMGVLGALEQQRRKA